MAHGRYSRRVFCANGSNSVLKYEFHEGFYSMMAAFLPYFHLTPQRRDIVEEDAALR